jgi:hypothetical protein
VLGVVLGCLLVGKESGDGSNRVWEVVSSTVVSGEGSPVPEVGDAVVDMNSG